MSDREGHLGVKEGRTAQQEVDPALGVLIPDNKFSQEGTRTEPGFCGAKKIAQLPTLVPPRNILKHRASHSESRQQASFFLAYRTETTSWREAETALTFCLFLPRSLRHGLIYK